MFTNPLFSHGLNFGTGTAYIAAQDTVKALNKNDFSKECFVTYEKYAQDIFRQNINETDMLHRAVNHVDSFERTLALKVYFGASDVLARDEYSETDPFVFDLLNPAWVEQVNKIVDVQRLGERKGIPVEQVAKKVRALVDSFSAPILELPQVKELELGCYMNFYNNNGKRVDDKKEKPRGAYKEVQCSCGLYYDDSLKIYPYWGQIINLIINPDNPLWQIAGVSLTRSPPAWLH